MQERSLKQKVVDRLGGEEKMIRDEEINKIIGGRATKYYERAGGYGYGERSWKAIGKKKTLIIWDCGNGWYHIVREWKNKEVK